MKNMKNVAAIAVLAALVSACSDADNTQEVTEQGSTNEAISESSAPITTDVAPASTFTAEAACEMAEDKLDADGDCETRKLQYNGQDVYVISAGDINGLVFESGKTQVLETPLYMDAFNAVQTYVASMKGPEVTEELFESAKQDIRLAKRGYILGVHFNGDVKGDIYITPKGRLSGALKAK